MMKTRTRKRRRVGEARAKMNTQATATNHLFTCYFNDHQSAKECQIKEGGSRLFALEKEEEEEEVDTLRRRKRRSSTSSNNSGRLTLKQIMCCLSTTTRAATAMIVICLLLATQLATQTHALEQNLKFDPISNAYQGLTFTFDPRLDKQVQERLHFDHWLALMQQTSSLLYESLNGRAHLGEVRVLIPYKWRHFNPSDWPLLHKPGSPIIANRRLRYADADILVGHEDPIHRETPYSVQHDECGRPGLNIRMPISFLDQTSERRQQQQQLVELETRLKARQLVREFASHRYGVFKESGFRSDFMYPPYSSVAGLWLSNGTIGTIDRHLSTMESQTSTGSNSNSMSNNNKSTSTTENPFDQLRGFDRQMRECQFLTSSSSGLPLVGEPADCLPYLVRVPSAPVSFNLMSADPFAHATSDTVQREQQQQTRPIEWNEQLSELTSWHFCGENFAPNTHLVTSNSLTGQELEQQQQQQVKQRQQESTKSSHFEHNQRASNKQNKMCYERSALDVIRASDDFRQTQFSPSTFNRLPAPNFKFLQEMPPRLILCFEYTSHLFQSRRLDHQMLEAAVNKFLAFDLIADSELATVVFGQHQARSLNSNSFQRLDSSLSSRFALFSPAIDPFDEQVQLYNQHELHQLGLQQAINNGESPSQQQQQVKLLKGSCSFGKLMQEVEQLLQRSSQQYDDVGADLIIMTSGLFVEDEPKIEEILKASSFKLEHNRLDLIIYPSGMLFDTKSRDGYIVLDSYESELIIKSRLNKLLLIERLTGAHIHLIREQLDPLGDVKMTTLVQFYQTFERLSRGYSWDQTNSMQLLASQQVDSRQNVLPSQAATVAAPDATTQEVAPSHNHKLSFQFELDNSIQNELLVGFIDPKVNHHHQQHGLNSAHFFNNQPPSSKAGKRFQLKNLQLRSPNGQFVFTETGTFWTPVLAASNRSLDEQQHQQAAHSDSSSTFFPHRSQLNLAAFHLRSWHLNQLQSVDKLAGTWTLSAISDEPLQTSGLALARSNQMGDSLIGNCWIQTYTSDTYEPSTQPDSQINGLKQVKVFLQANGGDVSLLTGRMEVQDEMGNIVQSVQMLDDGLGAPDMTQNDGILTQFVQRATRPGFYKVLVEMAVPLRQESHKSGTNAISQPVGQDNVCCGSSIPHSESTTRPTRQQPIKMATRQLYCGTFHVEANNRLGQQRPPRINNLTAVHVDQDNRRVTLRWFEPQLDISTPSLFPLDSGTRSGTNNQLLTILSDNDLMSDETNKLEQQQQQATGATPRRRAPRLSRRQVQDNRDELGDEEHQSTGKLDNVLIATHQSLTSGGAGHLLLSDQLVGAEQHRQTTGNRYEIKLFTDRDIMKRAFDAKHEIGFKFNEWNVEGQLPNASQYGGMKEVTLRVPFAREGFYFIAMKVYNNQGIGSHMSNIVQFYLRNNLTLEEVESIYNQPGTTVDAEGNVYDKNGELIHHHRSSLGIGGPATGNGQLLGSYSLLRGTGALDGLSALVLFSLLAFIMTIMCCTLLACLVNTARQTTRKKKDSMLTSGDKLDGADKSTSNGVNGALMLPSGCGSGSSMVSQSSGCESSQHSEAGGSSSRASTQNYAQQHVTGAPSDQSSFYQQQHDHLASIMQTQVGDTTTTTYNQLQQQQANQQHQAQMIHNQLISDYQEQQQQDFYNSPLSYSQPAGAGLEQWPISTSGQQPVQHTLVNGYTYATVMPQLVTDHQVEVQQQQYQMFTGDLNQNGLGPAMDNQQDQMYSTSSGQYDRLKRDPVMRFGSDRVEANEQQQQIPNYLNHQQLQQQLSSVLKSKRQQLFEPQDLTKSSSPALDGVTGEFEPTTAAIYGNHQHQMQADQMAPPPPQYVYCGATQLDTNGLGSANTARDPSIYSQTTNLQQVNTSNTHSPLDTGYYANHYDNPNSAWPAAAGTGVTTMSQQRHSNNGADSAAAISEV